MLSEHVLVTGANGFVGRNLCRQLVRIGKRVTACVRDRSDISSLAELAGSMKIVKIPSLDECPDLSKAFVDVDAVIHLAGRAHVMHETVCDPLQAFRNVNVRGTEHLAQIARNCGVHRFIYISSVKVNGESTNGKPFCADDPVGYSDPYGQSKWEAEERLRQLADATSMEWIIVRPPLVYGPGVKANFLSLLQAVVRGIPLPVGSLDNRRSLISVYNLSDLLCLVLDHPAAGNNCFLVSDQEDVSTPELVRQIADCLRCSPRIVGCPKAALVFAGVVLRRQAAIQRLCSSLMMDKEKVRKVLGWSAPMTLHQGLEHTANWFLSQLAAN